MSYMLIGAEALTIIGCVFCVALSFKAANDAFHSNEDNINYYMAAMIGISYIILNNAWSSSNNEIPAYFSLVFRMLHLSIVLLLTRFSLDKIKQLKPQEQWVKNISTDRRNNNKGVSYGKAKKEINN